MDVIKTGFDGLKIIKSYYAKDERGSFTKTFSYNELSDVGIDFYIKESYYSISNLNTIRGLHFQLPPYEHDKLVYVTRGEIKDVVIDLRSDSTTYLEIFTIDLNEDNNYALFIPSGFAHGFLSKAENTTTVYSVSSVYQKSHDSGVLWSSINLDWKVEEPIVSQRDNAFQNLQDFILENPF